MMALQRERERERERERDGYLRFVPSFDEGALTEKSHVVLCHVKKTLLSTDRQTATYSVWCL